MPYQFLAPRLGLTGFSVTIVPSVIFHFCVLLCAFLQKIRKMPLDEVVVLDADANQLEIYHNDLGIIPSDVVS